MQQIMTYIGFAVKSNHIVKGIDEVLKTKKKIFLIVISNELKGNSKEKLEMFSQNRNIQIKEIGNEVFMNLNLIGVKVLGITDPNLAKALLK